MNSKEIQSLTKRLAANPNFLREVEAETIRDLLLDYTAGILEPNVEQEVRELIASDPVAASMWKNFDEIDAHLRSPDGQQWTEEAGERILSNVLSEKRNIAGQPAAIEHAPSPETLLPAATAGSLLKTATAWVKERFRLFAELPQFETNSPDDVVFCSDSPSDTLNQRVLNLTEWYKEADLKQKLPWAAHVVVLMKVQSKNKPGMVRYRAFVEKRRGATSHAGSLRIALEADQQTDEITLQADAQSKTFQKAVLPGDAPVAFKPILD